MNLRDFLISGRQNAWLRLGSMEVYLRNTQHAIDGALHQTLDIANVNVSESEQRRGVFRQFFNDALKTAPLFGIEYIRVENVINDVLEGFCRRRGMSEEPTSGVLNISSFYLATTAGEAMIADDFADAVRESCAEAERLGCYPGRLYSMLAAKSALTVAKHLIGDCAGAGNYGFEQIMDKGKPEITLEAIALQERFKPLFTPIELTCAKRRLTEVGIDVSKLP